MFCLFQTYLFYTCHQLLLCLGSDIDFSGSQVKDIVIAYRVPLFNFSTKCRFSAPDVKKETLPTKSDDNSLTNFVVIL